jgi:hypothetical protein
MINIIEFILGLYLGYYILSPKLRRFTNRIIVYIFRAIVYTFKFWWSKPYLIKIEPAHQEVKLRTTAYKRDFTDKHEVVVEEGEVRDWLHKNPDLRKVNGI